MPEQGWTRDAVLGRRCLVVAPETLRSLDMETRTALAAVPSSATYILAWAGTGIPRQFPDAWTLATGAPGYSVLFVSGGQLVIEAGRVYIDPLEGGRLCVNDPEDPAQTLVVLEPIADFWDVIEVAEAICQRLAANEPATRSDE